MSQISGFLFNTLFLSNLFFSSHLKKKNILDFQGLKVAELTFKTYYN